MITAPLAAPTAANERLEVLDVLRGFAIFGILLVNMEAFSTSSYRSDTGERLWTGIADRIAESLITYGATGKFMVLFTFLFGLSFWLQMRRAAAQDQPFFRLQTRRLLVLLLIGLAHAHLIWWGDVLTSYALAGMLLVFFHRCRPRTILVWALVLNLVSFAELELQAFRAFRSFDRAPRQALTVDTGPAHVDAGLEAYGRGSLGQIMERRTTDFWNANADASSIVLRRLSFFLFGLFVGHLGILENLPGRRRLLGRVLVWALAIGLLAHLVRHVLSLQGLPAWTRLLRLPADIIGNPALALAYAAAVMLLFQIPAVRRRVSPLAAIGRTALSNYLLQSVICTAIFYHYGLGFYGKVGPAAGVGLSLLIFAVQGPLSVCWLRRFRFGPVEWVWRSLTYGRLQPLRLKPAPVE